MGVFSKENVPQVDINRNPYDLSHQNNLTMRFGTLYPCLCTPVIPGDSFKIKAAFGLRFLPLAFPLQTKIRCDVHMFYVRNRNLYEDFQDFYGNNNTSLASPVLSPESLRRQMVTGSLGDYLGLPSTVLNAVDRTISDAGYGIYPPQTIYIAPYSFDSPRYLISEDFIGNPDVDPDLESNMYPNTTNSNTFTLLPVKGSDSHTFNVGDVLRLNVKVPKSLAVDYTKLFAFPILTQEIDQSSVSFGDDTQYFSSSKSLTFEDIDDDYSRLKFEFVCRNRVTVPSVADTRISLQVLLAYNDSDKLTLGTNPAVFEVEKCSYVSTRLVEATKVLASNFAEVIPPISALPFRAYESIYNSFYRDDRNNPLMIDGVVRPNVYLRSTAGGVDDQDYPLYNRNWEQDYLTTALPSPQMGAAPLVGLTSTGVATYQSEDGVQYKVKLTTGDDADTVTGATYSTNIPNDVARSIVNIATSGISINDLRAVNSLQRWLETNIRRGLKYKDQLESHFGVKPRYDVLDMPEFIGGFSQFVDISQINQTSAGTEESPLGSYAGQASAIGGSKNDINVYCDEPGYIIGIISVVPVPVYNQLIPKHFYRNHTLDYFFPEFGHIGMQPIPYSEVCPFQAMTNGVALSRTFGYQRAWYDYLSAFDEVHGEFRKPPFSDFLLQRQFRTVPSLNPDFLTVNQDQLNDVFTVNESEDKILGQVHFDILSKRPIPRFGIPKLE